MVFSKVCVFDSVINIHVEYEVASLFCHMAKYTINTILKYGGIGKSNHI